MRDQPDVRRRAAPAVPMVTRARSAGPDPNGCRTMTSATTAGHDATPGSDGSSRSARVSIDCPPVRLRNAPLSRSLAGRMRGACRDRAIADVHDSSRGALRGLGRELSRGEIAFWAAWSSPVPGTGDGGRPGRVCTAAFALGCQLDFGRAIDVAKETASVIAGWKRHQHLARWRATRFRWSTPIVATRRR